MPPRHGKSELFSVHFPAWWLGRNPDGRVIHASYGADLSNQFSRRVRNLVRDEPRYRAVFPSVTIAQDSQSVTQWDISAPHRGGFRSVGVGSGVTGFGADLAIIDDPVRGAEAAESDTQREAVWQWYLSDVRTRLHPNAAIVLGLTRWHEDDLAGRILSCEDGHRWRVLSLPAINEAGQALWPERYPVDDLRRTEAAVGSRVWAALYQQQPASEQGNEFKAEWFTDRWMTLPPIVEAWSCWDTSLKDREHNDRTAFITVARGRDGLLYGVDGGAGHWSGDQIYEAITANHKAQQARFGASYRGEYVEDTAAGSIALQRARRDAGAHILPVKAPTTSKLLRARGVSVLCEARRFRPPALGVWWDTMFAPEVMAFPFAAHDDCLDSLVMALERYARHVDDPVPGRQEGTWKTPR